MSGLNPVLAKTNRFDEAGRLECLEKLRILDGAREDRLDTITESAALNFGVPMALITLLDSERQWVKSGVGVKALEVPRSVAFCQHTIQYMRLFLVENAREDVSFRNNPLVTGPPFVCFYAGAPLLIGGRHRIGSFCLLDDIPRKLDAAARRRLWMFAALASEAIEKIYARTD